ncbi:hypothetical protein LP7551_00252 [Roseibium album]|nr:hypothetical protein LP7551_00252 [Roseibium album]
MADVDVLSGRGERHSFFDLASVLAPVKRCPNDGSGGGGVCWTYRSRQRQAVG